MIRPKCAVMSGTITITRLWSMKDVFVLSALMRWQALITALEINFKPDTLLRCERREKRRNWMSLDVAIHLARSDVFAACLILVSKYFMSTFMCVYLSYCATITDFLPWNQRRLLHIFISKIAAYERRVNKMILCKRANRWECLEWRLRYVFDFMQFRFFFLPGEVNNFDISHGGNFFPANFLKVF